MSTAAKQYLSPVKKLARYFEKSRDRWKEKCLKAKKRVKLLHTKVADLQVSRERWKSEAKQLREELAQVQMELDKKIVGARG